MIEQLGGRKAAFGIFLVIVAVATQIWAPGGLTKTLADFFVAIGLGFFAGNGIEHAADAVKVMADSKAAVATASTETPEVDLTPLKTPLEETKVAMQAIINQNAMIGQTLQNVAQGTAALVNVVQGGMAGRS